MTLWNSGFFPRSIEEHISGFWIRNEVMLARIYSKFDEEQRDDVLTGRVALYDMLKRAELDLDKKKRKKRQKHKGINGLIRANKVAETIMSQRYVAERLMSRHVQPIKPGVRSAAKTKFFSIINSDYEDVDITGLQRLAPPAVSLHIRAARKQDRSPTSVGTSAQTEHMSLQRIRARRYLGVRYRDYCTQEEESIADMCDDDYEKAIAQLERGKHYEGLSYKSPVGLPICRVFDNRIYMRPASFNFSVEMNPKQIDNKCFTYKGIPVTNFKPIIYGSESLSRINKNDKSVRLAFGTGILKGGRAIFYKSSKRSGEIIAKHVHEEGRHLCSIKTTDCTVYYRLTIDGSPLLYIDHNSDHRPYSAGLIGDNEAILNYGFYSRSNQPSGFSVYQNLFKNFNSSIPHFVAHHMPQYPFFPYGTKSVEIDRGRITALRGYASIAKLRLTHTERPDKLVTVSLDGDVPLRVNAPKMEEAVFEW
jgi:hypothetical protein